MKEIGERSLEGVSGGSNLVYDPERERMIEELYEKIQQTDCKNCGRTTRYSCYQQLNDWVRDNFERGTTEGLRCRWKQ